MPSAVGRANGENVGVATVCRAFRRAPLAA